MRSTPSVIIDRSELFREGLAQLLTSRFCRVISAVGRVEDVSSSAASETPLLFILCSCDTTGSSVSLLRSSYPEARILVLANECEPVEMCEAMRRGANGYLSKSVSVQVLLKALDLLLDDVPIAPVGILPSIPSASSAIETFPYERSYAEPAVAHAGGDAQGHPLSEAAMSIGPGDRLPSHHHLSDQEMRVTQLLARGCTNKMIAIKLNITEATVKAHVKAILRKIRVRNRTQAALWAIENRLLPSPMEADKDAVKPDCAVAASGFA